MKHSTRIFINLTRPSRNKKVCGPGLARSADPGGWCVISVGSLRGAPAPLVQDFLHILSKILQGGNYAFFETALGKRDLIPYSNSCCGQCGMQVRATE